MASGVALEVATIRYALRVAHHVANYGVPSGGEQWPNAMVCLDVGRDLKALLDADFAATPMGTWAPDLTVLAEILLETWTKPALDPQARLQGWPAVSRSLADAYAKVGAAAQRAPSSGEVPLPRSRPRPTEADLLRAAECPEVVDGVVLTPLFEGTGWTAALEDFGGGGPGLVVWTHGLMQARVIASGPGLCTIEVNGGSVTHRLCVLDALRDAAPGST